MKRHGGSLKDGGRDNKTNMSRADLPKTTFWAYASSQIPESLCAHSVPTQLLESTAFTDPLTLASAVPSLCSEVFC